jgi:hypothetical protein
MDSILLGYDAVTLVIGFRRFQARWYPQSAESKTYSLTRVISGFRRDVDQICALLGYYAASSGNSVPTFRDNLSVPSSRVKKSKKESLIIERVDTTLHRNAGIRLPTDTASYPRRTPSSATWLRKRQNSQKYSTFLYNVGKFLTTRHHFQKDIMLVLLRSPSKILNISYVLFEI